MNPPSSSRKASLLYPLSYCQCKPSRVSARGKQDCKIFWLSSGTQPEQLILRFLFPELEDEIHPALAMGSTTSSSKTCTVPQEITKSFLQGIRNQYQGFPVSILAVLHLLLPWVSGSNHHHSSRFPCLGLFWILAFLNFSIPFFGSLVPSLPGSPPSPSSYIYFRNSSTSQYI